MAPTPGEAQPAVTGTAAAYQQPAGQQQGGLQQPADPQQPAAPGFSGQHSSAAAAFPQQPAAAPYQPASPQQPQLHQPTTPLPAGLHESVQDQLTAPQPEYAAAAEAAGAHGGGSSVPPYAPLPENGRAAEQPSAHPKSRTGALIAGLAIGALLGGAVGGGVAAVVSSNSVSPTSASGTATGTVTIKNPENATAVSAVAAVATPSVVTLEVSSTAASGSGSGVIYSEDGYIITNAHVVTLDGATQDATIRVKLSDGRIVDGDVVGIDPYADLAVVKVEADGLTAIDIADSDQLDVGDTTVAIGAPLNLASTVTSGVVSALNRGISVGSPLIPEDTTQEEETPDQTAPDDGGGSEYPWDFRFGLPDEESQEQEQSTGGNVTLPVIQTDASINPGNSGGALLNGEGKLIGINVAIASAVTSEDGSAGSNGLGFAIPSNLAARVADSIIAGDQPSHGLLGASVADSSADTDADADYAGGLIAEVSQGGAADKAGLQAGDVVTAVDGVPAVDGTSVSALIRMHEGGSTISIEYRRDGQEKQTEAELGTLEW